MGVVTVPVIFPKFVTELRALIDIKISFPLNILRITPNFIYAFILVRSSTSHILQIYIAELLSLTDVLQDEKRYSGTRVSKMIL